jgi:hypothetical protein
MGTHTFRQQGVTDQYLGNQVPAAFKCTAGQAVPIVFQPVTIDDEDGLPDLIGAMESAGWTYDHEGDPTVAKTIAQIVPNALVSDASSIPVASGWVDVLSSTLTTLGNSSVGVQVSAVGNPSVGVGQARVIVNGGDFTDMVVGATAYDIPTSSQGVASFNAPRTIPDTSPTPTTYTFKLQMQATGGGGAVVPRAGTVMSLIEYR